MAKRIQMPSIHIHPDTHAKIRFCWKHSEAVSMQEVVAVAINRYHAEVVSDAARRIEEEKTRALYKANAKNLNGGR